MMALVNCPVCGKIVDRFCGKKYCSAECCEIIHNERKRCHEMPKM
jgi:predicted nucleic acid-binding Zn ribbon protein